MKRSQLKARFSDFLCVDVMCAINNQTFLTFCTLIECVRLTTRLF